MSLILLLHNNPPCMIIPAVHNVFHPLLDYQGIFSSLTIAHTKTDVLSSMVDQRNGADEELNVTKVSKV